MYSWYEFARAFFAPVLRTALIHRLRAVPLPQGEGLREELEVFLCLKI